jgi:gamma-glutamyltranspeptidase/glutathione hydrolase/leukotriene-C4 hydrolase
MLDNPTWSAVYAPRGPLLVEGEYVKRTNYGKTLEKIAKHGASVFYSGEIAESTVNTLQSLGGIMEIEDVRYQSIHAMYLAEYLTVGEL